MRHLLRSGQVTVFVILLGILGLTLGLSVASRSLSDLRQTAFTDAGSRAYAAAEAGVRYALYLYSHSLLPVDSCSVWHPISFGFSGVSSVSYLACGNSPSSVIVPNVSPDDVAEVDLSNIQQNNVKGFAVLWKNNNASVEVFLVGQDLSGRRWAMAGQNVSTTNNNFSASSPASTCVQGGANPCADSSFSGGSCTGWNPAIIPFLNPSPPGVQAKTLRVKPLGGATDIAVCAITAGNSPGRMVVQYVIATASATTVNNVTRKVQALVTPPTMPAIFDNAIFSGGDLTK